MYLTKSQKLTLARRTNNHSEMSRLAADDDIDVKVELASNLSLPETILALLAKDPNITVRTVVAGNPLTKSRLLHVLSKDVDRRVRLAVASHDNTFEKDLRELSRDSQMDIRIAARVKLIGGEEVMTKIMNATRETLH